MGTKQILLLITTVVYFWLAHAFVNRVCSECDNCKSEQVREAVTSSSTGAVANSNQLTEEKLSEPIVFQWSNADAITSDNFENYKAEILSQMETGRKLEVYGYYFKEEETPTNYVNMGLARADELIELLSETIPKEKMTPRAQLIDEDEGVRENYFISTRHRWVDVVPEEYDASSKKDDERVDEVGDRTLIYFAFNSTKKEINPEVDTYLAKIAERIKSTGEAVELLGHTDDIGSEMSNYALALRRAEMIQKILVSKGVDSSKITIESKGELEPTAPNNNDANRRLNRRVELKIKN